jgi:hypothetical protein
MNLHFDGISMKIVYILSILIILNLGLFIFSIIKIIKKKKQFFIRGTFRIIALIVSTLLMAVFIYLITIIPSLLGFNVPLSWGLVWMPQSFGLAILWIFLTVFLLYLFVLSVILFSKKKT